jgi:hypothetical protein
MKYLRVNDYDMAYIEVGQGRPLVCVHGTINDFRFWSAVLGPLSRKHRVIALSLRHYFPEQWDGRGGKFRIAQHVADVIGFIERLNTGKVDLFASQPKGRGNGEHKLRPTPARQSWTLLIGRVEETSGTRKARSAPRSYPTAGGEE